MGITLPVSVGQASCLPALWPGQAGKPVLRDYLAQPPLAVAEEHVLQVVSRQPGTFRPFTHRLEGLRCPVIV